MSILNEKTISRYEVIQKELTEKIQNGIFKPNERIPSEKEIVEQYGVSRITATKALTELSLNGYIYRIQGKGSFVNAPDKWIRPGRFFVSERDTRRAGVQRTGLLSRNFMTIILEILSQGSTDAGVSRIFRQCRVESK